MSTVAISVYAAKKLTIDRALSEAQVNRDISLKQLETAKEMERIVKLLEEKEAKRRHQ